MIVDETPWPGPSWSFTVHRGGFPPNPIDGDLYESTFGLKYLCSRGQYTQLTDEEWHELIDKQLEDEREAKELERLTKVKTIEDEDDGYDMELNHVWLMPKDYGRSPRKQVRWGEMIRVFGLNYRADWNALKTDLVLFPSGFSGRVIELVRVEKEKGSTDMALTITTNKATYNPGEEITTTLKSSVVGALLVDLPIVGSVMLAGGPAPATVNVKVQNAQVVAGGDDPFTLISNDGTTAVFKGVA